MSAMDPGDPRALLEAATRPAEGGEALGGGVTPLVAGTPLPAFQDTFLRGSVPIDDAGATVPRVVVPNPAPEVFGPPMYYGPKIDTDPVVHFIAYAIDDPLRRITTHGQIQRSLFASFSDALVLHEVSELAELNLSERSAWNPDTASVVLLPDNGVSVEYVRYHATVDIDGTAEKLRLLLITPGAGQALIYQAKKEEARAFLDLHPTSASSESENPENWPMLAAEVPVTAPSMWLVAQTVLYMARRWMAIAATLETVRLEAKVKIAEAPDAAAIQAIVASVPWPVVVDR